MNTPILPEPLTGPMIFVSHGGEAFPSLILVLQGYGFTIDIVGSTYINPQGITSSTFKAIPDEPVGDFQLTIPQGKYSALAATANLCKLTRVIHVKQKEIRDVKGQRRRVTIKTSKRIPAKLVHADHLHRAKRRRRSTQNTPISVTGCPKAKLAKKHKKAKGKRKKK